MSQKIYRVSRWSRFLDFALRSFIVTCFTTGVVVTGGVVYYLGKFYLVDNPELKRQRVEYQRALQLKEKREKELGLRD